MDGQQLLADDGGERIKARTGTPGEDDAFV
jgi:hypothetical protein